MISSTPNIIYKFGKRNFLGFIICEIIGFGFLIFTLTPNPAGRYVIYLHLILIIPAFIAIGFYLLSKSLKTANCSSCQTELEHELKAFPYEKHMDLITALELKKKDSLAAISSIPLSSKPRTEVNFIYCPSCVAIAKILIFTVGDRKEKRTETIIQGSFVREWKEGLRFK